VSGAVVWLTGLPSSGKSTIAAALAARLRGEGQSVEVLDGDELRAELCADLGFERADRDENVKRIGYVAALLARHGVTVVCPVVSPYQAAPSAASVSRKFAPQFHRILSFLPRSI